MAELEDKGFPWRPGQIRARDVNRLRDVPVRQIRPGPGITADYFGDRVSVSGNPAPAPETTEQGLVICPFVIAEEFDDYLLCYRYYNPNSSVGNDNYPATPPYQFEGTYDTNFPVYVAKPWVLQRAPWDSAIWGAGQPEVVTYFTPLNAVNLEALQWYVYDYTNPIVPPGFGIVPPASGPIPGVRTSTLYQFLLGAVVTTIETIQPRYTQGNIIMACRRITGLKDPNGNDVLWEDLNTAGRHWDSGTTMVDNSLNLALLTVQPNQPLNNAVFPGIKTLYVEPGYLVSDSPNQVRLACAYAYATFGQGIGIGTTTLALTGFGQAGGYTLDAPNKRIIVPVQGQYIVTVQAQHPAGGGGDDGTGSNRRLIIQVGTNGIIHCWPVPGAFQLSGTTMIYQSGLAQGGVVGPLQVTQDSGGTISNFNGQIAVLKVG